MQRNKHPRRCDSALTINHQPYIVPLYLVSTPVGNLEDITHRALNVLREVDLIAAEDTRVTGRMLKHFGISKPMMSFYEHNEKGRIVQLIERLNSGDSVAVVSNAGTPGISDPGYPLVRACVDEEIEIIPIPGATALVPAVVASGLPVNEFWYRGFPPRRPGRRDRFLEESKGAEATLVFYESPYRIKKLVEACLNVYGDRQCALCRELTKKFEEIVRGSLSDILERMNEKEPRGEYVLVVAGNEEEA
jgi:16S rRNA (cytidine1402-2'-O)-methyltransferase